MNFQEAQLRLLLPTLLLLAPSLVGQVPKKTPGKAPSSKVEGPMPTDLQGCAAIRDNNLRLAAYDNLARAQRESASAFTPEEREVTASMLSVTPSCSPSCSPPPGLERGGQVRRRHP
jgi:hypothetical protein